MHYNKKLIQHVLALQLYKQFTTQIPFEEDGNTQKREVPPGFEPSLLDSKSGVLTTTLWNRMLYIIP
ncbi:hypothetical protein DAI22_02g109400 [Oryza sativa Japonica Group]|nr:hypothetical protein DAI22_02g109400 [Oryza sativa Japonica Group]